MLYAGLAILVALMFIFAILSYISRKIPDRGMVDGRLKPCPDAPNCVNSEYHGKSFIKPLFFHDQPARAWKRVKFVIQGAGGSIEIEERDYLRAVFTSKIFRFHDDLELRMDRERGIIHIRSASRVGYSDFGQNRKRAERIRVRFQEAQQ